MTSSPSPNSARQDFADLGQVPNLATLPPSEDIDFSEDLDSTIQHICTLMRPTLQSDKQRDYNSLHYRLGHLSHQRLQELVTLGKLPIRFKNCTTPICPACLFAKQTRRQWPHHNSHSRSLHDLAASTSGSLTFADQMVSTTPGLIPQSTGKLTKRRFCAATVFIDSHSDYTHVFLQEDLSMDSMLNAKLDYERRANAFGISIKGYHADNGRFADAAWRDSCFALQQSFQFCGIGSHHQNGIAERRIRDLSDATRASLLHAIQHWPDGVSKNLWPFALKYACNIHNKVRSNDGHTPEEIFSGMPSSSYVDLTQFHPFGCPVYVLDARLQTGNKIPRWEPRSRVGVYLGHSPYHAQSVTLILNLSTGHISPQYHLVYDDHFSTAQSLRLGTVPTNWPDLCSNHRESLTDENFQLSPDWTLDADTPQPSIHWLSGMLDSEAVILDSVLQQDISAGASASSRLPRNEGDAFMDSNVGANFNIVQANEGDQVMAANERESDMKPSQRLDHQPVHHSERIRRPTSHLIEEPLFGCKATCSNTFQRFNLRTKALRLMSFIAIKMQYEESLQQLDDGSINQSHFFAFPATLADNDTYYYSQAMQQPDRSDFIRPW